MVQLSICCSSRAVPVAERLSARLERNLGIATLLVAEDEAPVSQTWEEGAAADAVLILFDKTSAPAPMRREDWTGLIDHGNEPPLAFARLEECAYPKLLERRHFFPAADATAFDRAVERWIVGLLPVQTGMEPSALEVPVPVDWWPVLVDTPGQITTPDVAAAQAFAKIAAPHFQAVVWIGCAGREPALIRAELDHRVRDGRVLAVLAHIDKPLHLAGARHSYIQVQGSPVPGEGSAALGCCYAPGFPGWLACELGGDLAGAVPLDAAKGTYRLAHTFPTDDATRRRHLEILHRHFRTWKEEPEPCRALAVEVPAAITFGFLHDWTRGSELCRRAAFLLLRDGRRREGIRLLHRLLVEAEERGDTEIAGEARHELSWLNEDDEPSRAETTTGEQLALNLFG